MDHAELLTLCSQYFIKHPIKLPYIGLVWIGVLFWLHASYEMDRGHVRYCSTSMHQPLCTDGPAVGQEYLWPSSKSSNPLGIEVKDFLTCYLGWYKAILRLDGGDEFTTTHYWLDEQPHWCPLSPETRFWLAFSRPLSCWNINTWMRSSTTLLNYMKIYQCLLMIEQQQCLSSPGEE